MVLEENVKIDRELIAEFCRRHHIMKLSIYGSALTDRFRSDSDIDVLVEFEPGKTPGLAFVDVEQELSEILGGRVEATTPAGLSKYIRSHVEESAQTIYGGDQSPAAPANEASR